MSVVIFCCCLVLVLNRQVLFRSLRLSLSSVIVIVIRNKFHLPSFSLYYQKYITFNTFNAKMYPNVHRAQVDILSVITKYTQGVISIKQNYSHEKCNLQLVRHLIIVLLVEADRFTYLSCILNILI